MNVSQNSMQVSAEIIQLNRDFMIVRYSEKDYRIDFDRFPYFRACSLNEIYNVKASAVGIHWPDADIDIEVEYLENPLDESNDVPLEWWKKQRKRMLSRLGSVGGKVSSPKKAAASRLNGKKGGRPRKNITGDVVLA